MKVFLAFVNIYGDEKMLVNESESFFVTFLSIKRTNKFSNGIGLIYEL